MTAPAFDLRAQHAAELRLLHRLHPRPNLADFARWALAHPGCFGFGPERWADVRIAARALLADLGEPMEAA